MHDIYKKLEIISNKRALYQALLSTKKESLTKQELDIMLLLSDDVDIKTMFDENGKYKFKLFRTW